MNNYKKYAINDYPFSLKNLILIKNYYNLVLIKKSYEF
jgi:hypothetical protein